MILYCKNCGSEIEVNDGQNTVVCDFCGMEQTVPKADDPQKLELFIKANEYRMASRFDVAKKQYEKIIAEYPDDNEAYWCKLLCEYGIEYVDDVLTEKKLPTCHRTVKESIFDNKDYKLIMGRATAEEKAIYESEAKEIDRIQKEILAKAEKEEPFDIFICYKESDENGKRTRDSQIATKIYSNLVGKGYKVFFARVTLKELAGSKYEPVIYSALTSAKVMLVVSTSKEYVNAPWVRNEWSRYLEFMQTDYSKTIVPCISIMDAYELPEELVEFQALNTSDMDFTETLTRQIDSKFGRVTATQKKPEPITVSSARIVENATQTSNNATIQPLLKRIQIFLADKEWNEADEYCEKVLDIDPECVEAYLGKLLAELKVSDKESLKSCAQPFDTAKNYKKVLRYADNELKKFLENAVDYIKERNENARKQGIYERATKQMLSAKTESDYKEAGNLYKSIIDWKDSKEQIEYCKNRIEEIKAEQIAAEQAAKQLEERCRLLVSSLDRTKSKAEIENTKKEAQRSLDELLARNNKRAAVLAKFPTLQEQINKANNEIEVLEKKISMLTVERAKLGFFAMKRKKEIDEEVRNIESEKFELKSKKQLIEKETLGYKTKGELERDIEKTQSEIEEVKKKLEELNKLQTKDEIIAELKKTTVGKKYYEGTIEYKKESLRKEREKARVGETVKFGSYYQSNNTTKEDIEWQVLSKAGNKLLLISKYALDCKRYNTSYTDVTWETCTLRKWLNNEFIDEAFNGDEKLLIPTVTVSADKNPNYSTNPGYATKDKVFLLSIPEANKYFSNSAARQCKPTAYAKKNGAWENTDNGNCWWWLRSPGSYQYYAASVYSGGDVCSNGNDFNYGNNAVRPALWVNLE